MHAHTYFGTSAHTISQHRTPSSEFRELCRISHGHGRAVKGVSTNLSRRQHGPPQEPYNALTRCPKISFEDPCDLARILWDLIWIYVPDL